MMEIFRVSFFISKSSLMKKVLLLFLLCSIVGMISVSAQNSVKPTAKIYSVSETLNLLKGQWRYMYKLIGDDIFYNQAFGSGRAVIDTSEIHTYSITAAGATKYFTDWENVDGTQALNAANSTGSWDLEKAPGGDVVIVLRNAFFKGCPQIRRKVLMINTKQMLLLDPNTGDRYYFNRKVVR